MWTSPPGSTGGGWPDQAGTPPSPGTGGPPPTSQPPEPREESKPKGKRKGWLLVGAGAVVLVAALVAGTLLLWPKPGPKPPNEEPTSGQTVLTFAGLNFRLSPGGVALDSAGDVYVTNQGMYGRVVKLAAGSKSPTVLPFTGLYEPQGLAVDASGAVYVADFNNRVVKMASGSNTQTELPIAGLAYPEGVAVDAAGNVYVADRGNNRVVRLTTG